MVEVSLPQWVKIKVNIFPDKFFLTFLHFSPLSQKLNGFEQTGHVAMANSVVRDWTRDPGDRVRIKVRRVGVPLRVRDY